MNYNEALKLDVSILEALLQRNRCGHGKAKYFQRTSMALRSILRANALDILPAVTEWKDQLLRRKDQANKKRKRQQSDEVFWDMNTLQHDLGAKDKSIQNLRQIQQTLESDFPEILSRIEFASQPLFLEICRGYFLPFCTIALAALARVRTLLMRIGHEVITVLQSVQQELESESSSSVQYEEIAIIQTIDMTSLRTQFTETSSSQSPVGPIKNENNDGLDQLTGDTMDNSKRKGKAGNKDENSTINSAVENETQSTDGAGSANKRNKKSPYSTMDDDDVGHAVLSLDNTDTQIAAAATVKATPTPKSTAPAPLVRASLDDKKKNKKRKKSDDDSKKKKPPKAKEATGSSKKDKKKKQKQKKNDFFDQLFD